MLLVRHLGRMATDLARYGTRTGRWWHPVLFLVLMVGAIAVLTAKAAVPVVVYTLF